MHEGHGPNEEDPTVSRSFTYAPLGVPGAHGAKAQLDKSVADCAAPVAGAYPCAGGSDANRGHNLRRFPRGLAWRRRGQLSCKDVGARVGPSYNDMGVTQSRVRERQGSFPRVVKATP